MNELLRYTFEEAARQADRLPSEPVGAVVFVFSADGTGAPVLACEEADVLMITRRFMEVAAHMLREMNSSPGLTDDDSQAADRRDLLEAERILANVMQRLRRSSAR